MAIIDAEMDAQGCWRLIVDKPSSTLCRCYAISGPRSVLDGNRGQCYVSGYVKVAYDSGTPTNGDSWGAKPGQFTASKDYPPCLDVLGVWKPTEKIMQAYLHPINEAIGKLDSTLAQGGSATVSIWAGTGGSEADTGLNVVAFDWLMKSGASDIAAGKKFFFAGLTACPTSPKRSAHDHGEKIQTT